MDNYAYSSYPDTGDSSPRSREIEPDPAVAVATWDEQPPPRVKLLCSYGGRIQPRAHDNNLSYVGGDTKILAVYRSVRFSTIIGKLGALSGVDDVILKYQLPGEDLDSLISVTNDEDVEHMMLEYDRIHRSGSKPISRLRLFLFASAGKCSQDRTNVADPTPSLTPKEAPDYLFGLEAAEEVRDPAPAEDKVGIEVAPVISAAEELQRLKINSMQRNGSDEALTRGFPPLPVQEKAPAAPAPTQAPLAAYYAPPTRFSSFMGGDGNLYLVPTLGGFPANAVPGQTYYTTLQRMVPAQAAYDNGGVRAHAAVEVSVGYGAPAVGQGPYDNAAGYAAAYDSSGGAVYYHQAVNGVAIGAESKIMKPSHVS